MPCRRWARPRGLLVGDDNDSPGCCDHHTISINTALRQRQRKRDGFSVVVALKTVERCWPQTFGWRLRLGREKKSPPPLSSLSLPSSYRIWKILLYPATKHSAPRLTTENVTTISTASLVASTVTRVGKSWGTMLKKSDRAELDDMNQTHMEKNTLRPVNNIGTYTRKWQKEKYCTARFRICTAHPGLFTMVKSSRMGSARQTPDRVSCDVNIKLGFFYVRGSVLHTILSIIVQRDETISSLLLQGHSTCFGCRRTNHQEYIRL